MARQASNNSTPSHALLKHTSFVITKLDQTLLVNLIEFRNKLEYSKFELLESLPNKEH